MADDYQASIDEEDRALEKEYKGVIVSPRKVYLKDVSFETPNSPEIFREEWKPSISVDAKTTSRQLDNGLHDVIMAMTVTVTLGEKVAYLAEVHQGGLFYFKGLDSRQLDQTINVFCMRFLYPYVTATLLDLISKGEFPQIFLPPMHFSKMYKQRILEKEEAEETQKKEDS